MKEKTESLEQALKAMMAHVRCINELEKEINERWGVRLVSGNIPALTSDVQGEIIVRRGMEEVEDALGKKAETTDCSHTTKELAWRGVRFIAFADDKTKVFVRAGQEKPKVTVEE